MRILRAIVGRAIWAIPALLFALSGRRLIMLTHPDRIGHLAGEMDCLLKEVALGRIPARHGILLVPENGVANRALLDYWSRYVTVVRAPLIRRALEGLYRFRRLRYCEDVARYLVAINSTAQFVEVQRLWGNRAPLLTLTAADLERGREALVRLGVPPGAPFVCFHGREGGYSPHDEHLHSFRNNSIENFLPAMQALGKRGIWSIRLGDPSMRPLPALEHVVDYARSNERTDWLDLYLCAQCRFFVGNTSGLFLVPTAFGVPCCLTNLIPFSAAPAFGTPHDLGIPKLLWSENEQRHLGFREILDSPIGDFRFSELYREHGLRPVENSAEDVLDLVLEMTDRIDGRLTYTSQDEALQAHFKALLKPGHMSYGAASRVGRSFLTKYAYLLDSQTDKP